MRSFSTLAAAAVLAVLTAACGDSATTTTLPPATTTSTTTTTVVPTTTSLDTTTTTAPACSAEGLAELPVRQPGLPDTVAATRDAIVVAATACDGDALTAIATAGAAGFTYSFGGSDDVAGFFATLAEDDEGVLTLLVELLNRPFGTTEAEGTTFYAWPSAFVYPSWDAVPPLEREALRPVYDDDDFDEFAGFGAYIGYRIVITDTGDWTAFVAGD